MATKHGGFTPAITQEKTCWAQWRAGVDCPNEASHVIVVTHAYGEMQVCEIHREGFIVSFPGTGFQMWPIAEWRAIVPFSMEVGG